MGKLDIDIAEVKKLVELVEAHNLEEITVEEGDLSITVKGRSTAPTSVVVQPAPQTAVVEAADEILETEAAAEEEIEGTIVDIVAPVIGVFYRAPSPDAPAFVEVGDVIEVGTEVGLIEAMKVFSPVPSEIAGEVVAIPAESGKLVQEGQVLIRVRVSE